jgi:alpha-beta hydrolase superfamily lysophospholipase
MNVPAAARPDHDTGTHVSAAPPAAITDVRIAVEGQEIHGKLLGADRPGHGGGVLFVHGWGASQRQDIGKAKKLRGRGFTCLTFNLRGHARTRAQIETVTRAQNLADVAAAYDALARTDGVDERGIGIIASSYGAYLAVLLTTERRVRSLALQAPALYKDDDFDRPKRALNLDPDLAAYRRRQLGPDDNRALRAAAAFRGDVLLVESEHDTVIPSPVIANYREAFRAARSLTHTVIAGADHALGDARARDAYMDLLLDWFPTTLASRGRRHRARRV